MIPLRISSLAGGIASGVGFLMAVITAIRKIVDPSLVSGWASMMCVTMVFAGMILMCLGSVGEYLGKIIRTLNHTPQFIERETINVSEQREEI